MQSLIKMEQVVLKFSDNELIIKKLPIGRYAELLRQLKKLPKVLKTLPEINTSTILEALPDILAESEDDFFGLINIATDIPVDELKKYGLNEIVDIVIAVFEVNQYKEVYEKIKKALSQNSKKKLT